ncbi:MAG: hypothetical protein ACKOX2_10950 [Microcystaceae cyanobacterium]
MKIVWAGSPDSCEGFKKFNKNCQWVVTEHRHRDRRGLTAPPKNWGKGQPPRVLLPLT